MRAPTGPPTARWAARMNRGAAPYDGQRFRTNKSLPGPPCSRCRDLDKITGTSPSATSCQRPNQFLPHQVVTERGGTPACEMPRPGPPPLERQAGHQHRRPGLASVPFRITVLIRGLKPQVFY